MLYLRALNVKRKGACEWDIIFWGYGVAVSACTIWLSSPVRRCVIHHTGSNQSQLLFLQCATEEGNSELRAPRTFPRVYMNAVVNRCHAKGHSFALRLQSAAPRQRVLWWHRCGAVFLNAEWSSHKCLKCWLVSLQCVKIYIYITTFCPLWLLICKKHV